VTLQLTSSTEYTVLTRQLSPATGVAPFSAGKQTEQIREADRSHRLVELHRMCQFQQHYVAGELPSWSIEFMIDEHFAYRNTNCELVWLRSSMQTNYCSRLVDAEGTLEPAQQVKNQVLASRLHFAWSMATFHI